MKRVEPGGARLTDDEVMQVALGLTARWSIYALATFAGVSETRVRKLVERWKTEGYVRAVCGKNGLRNLYEW
jgi:DNA-binding IscR family transcriptional regulator